MNERNLFRGKNIKGNGLVYGYLSWADEILVDRESEFGKSLNLSTSKVYDIDPTTIGQCTGLRDRNDRLIFEADIVKCLKPAGHSSTGIVKYITEHARWEYWHAKQKEGFPIISDSYNLKIIGNVHDNPELLEEVQ